MIKLSKKIEYSLMALKYMSSKPEGHLVTVREICDDLKIPFDTVSKVMQNLNNNDLLSSVKGTRGGYTIVKDLRKVSFSDLSEIVEGKKNTMSCLTSKGTLCELHDHCNVIGPIDHLSRKVAELLSKLSIQEILFGENTETCPIDMMGMTSKTLETEKEIVHD
ncbi:MAG: RrF2 family transcriptional regulator [Bacteriovoracaceae bacterium]